MAKKETHPKTCTDGQKAPDGFAARRREYVEAKLVRNHSPVATKKMDRGLAYFEAWCAELDVTRPTEVTRALLDRYARHLCQLRKSSGEPLSVATRHRDLSALRCFFRFLARKNYLLTNPAHELELPKLGHRLPRTVLTHEEVERVLAQPDVKLARGIRDRAMLETLYSTGIRRGELTRLRIFDVDAARGTLTVRQGKGRKDRVMPIGERALDWINRYRSDVRPSFVVDPNEHTLFARTDGRPFTTNAVGCRVRNYVLDANLGKSGSCHLFRHTMATLMMERGADVRVVQEMLGHASLEATQIYTHVSINHLKQVHAQAHPGAKRSK